MITAIDTNILLDVLIPDEPFGDESEEALSAALRNGPLVICEPVLAEIAYRFESQSPLEFMERAGIVLASSTVETLRLAGEAWVAYSRSRPEGLLCQNCGNRVALSCPRCHNQIRIRHHILSDFLIGAHARRQADRLLTRDRRYFSTYFPDLRLA